MEFPVRRFKFEYEDDVSFNWIHLWWLLPLALCLWKGPEAARKILAVIQEGESVLGPSD